MDNLIYGETIKNAFAQKLSELYPDVVIFKEEEDQTAQFPNFFVLQLNASSQENRKDHYFITYFMTIRYRVAADINTVNKLEQKLDKMGSDMLINLVDIPLFNRPHKLKNCNYEKIDGVLHFFANVTIQTVKAKEPEPIMNKLDLHTTIIGEN